MTTTLPGVRVTLADAAYPLADSQAAGPRVCIIADKASSADGALHDPQLYGSEAAVVAAFGAGSDAHVAYKQALDGGAKNIYIVATDPTASDREAELAAALAVVDLVEPDLLVPYGFHANAVVAGTPDRLANFAVAVGTKCHELTRDLSPCFAVMAVEPIGKDSPTAQEVEAYVQRLVAAKDTDLEGDSAAPIANVLDAVSAVEIGGATVDLGKYLALSVGEVKTLRQPTSGFTTAEAVIAGCIYRTPLEDAITLEPVYGATALNFGLSRAQRLSLIAKRATPLHLSTDRVIVAGDGWTLAGALEEGSSVYDRISTVRIAHEVIKSTRYELEKFIGMQASTARLNSIETKLRSIYMALKQAGLVRTIDFTMEYSISSGTLSVAVALIPAGEIRVVDLTVAVRISA